MKSKKPIFIIIILIMVITISCQRPKDTYGYIEITQTVFPGQTAHRHYGIYYTHILSDNRLSVRSTLNDDPQIKTFPFIIQDYKYIGSYSLSLNSNQIGDHDFDADWEHDSLYGTINITEADSVAKFFKANFNGVYTPNTLDTVNYPFYDGYMEVHY